MPRTFAGFIRETAWRSHRHGRFVPLAALCILLAGSVAAQGPSPGQGTSPTPQVHAEAVEIVLDLIARDKHNRPVTNLSAGDIAVTDGGNAVELSGLHLVNAQSGAGTRIAMLFDNLSPESAKAAEDFAGRVLAAAPAEARFAVLGADRGLRLLEDYTTDRAAVRAALQTMTGGIPQKDLSDAERALVSITQNGTLPGGGNASVEDRANAKWMLETLEDSQKVVEERHVQPVLAGMLALARAEQNLAGRKVILFFSDGLRSTSKTEDQTRDVVEAANRAGVSIFTVDTKGVASKSFDVLTMMYQPGHQLAARNGPSPIGMWQPSLEGNITQVAGIQNDATGANHVQDDLANAAGNSLAFLANGTGGFAITIGDDWRRPLEHFLGDVGNYYEATYTPPVGDYDGKFHPLDVRAVREGITIRSRSGYFALSPEAIGSGAVRPSEAPLMKLLSDAAPPNQIAFNQAVLRLGKSGAGRGAGELAVEVPVANLELRKDQQTKLFAARASILTEVKDKSDVVVERFHEDYSRNGALETMDAARAGTVTMQRHFALAPGDYEAETVVLDRVSGKAGMRRTAFTVPPAESGPWLSDVVLVRRTQPFSGAPDPGELLQYQNARVVPNVDRDVPAGTGQVSFVVRVGRDAAAGDGTLALDVERGGMDISHTAWKVVDAPGVTTSLSMAGIDTRKMSAGTYRAVFTLTQGTKSATRDVVFNLEGNPGEPAKADVPDEDTETLPGDLGNEGAGLFTADAAGQAPASALQDALLTSARGRAGEYLKSLVNFKCLEVTDRYVDHKGNGKVHHDKIAEALTYENGEESRQLLEVNGTPTSQQQVDMAGARLEGAFGGALEIVFDPLSNAHFEWKQKGALDGAAVEVFDYTVDAMHSKFSVTPLPASSVLVPFHGQLYIDTATRGVRRITIEGDNIPADSPIHASSLSIDYDYVTMNDHDYLVPVRGEMRMQLGKQEKILHRIEFRDYHRFGSKTRIISVDGKGVPK